MAAAPTLRELEAALAALTPAEVKHAMRPERRALVSPEGPWALADGAGPHILLRRGTVAVSRVGNRAAGHLLDGREHREVPR